MSDLLNECAIILTKTFISWWNSLSWHFKNESSNFDNKVPHHSQLLVPRVYLNFDLQMIYHIFTKSEIGKCMTEWAECAQRFASWPFQICVRWVPLSSQKPIEAVTLFGKLQSVALKYQLMHKKETNILFAIHLIPFVWIKLMLSVCFQCANVFEFSVK